MPRDTNEDWRGISGEPYYGVFSHLGYMRENLTPERLQGFWQSGIDEIGWQIDLLRRHYGSFTPASAIDFGCGVGRLSRAMARETGHVYGIDVAPLMLEEARRGAPTNIEFRTDLPDQSVDWINSNIVFQHIHPVNGIPLLRTLLNKLNSGGGMTLQFGIYKQRSMCDLEHFGVEYASWDGERMTTLIENPAPPGTMMMYDYDLNQVIAMMHRVGIDSVSLHHSNHGGHHGVFVIGRRP